MSDQLYCDSADRYFTDLDDAFDWYHSAEPDKVPEYLVGTKSVEISDTHCLHLAELIIDHVDSHCPELSCEEWYFSEVLTVGATKELADLIKGWLQKHSSTVVPDYDHKEPFREAYAKWLAEDE